MSRETCTKAVILVPIMRITFYQDPQWLHSPKRDWSVFTQGNKICDGPFHISCIYKVVICHVPTERANCTHMGTVVDWKRIQRRNHHSLYSSGSAGDMITLWSKYVEDRKRTASWNDTSNLVVNCSEIYSWHKLGHCPSDWYVLIEWNYRDCLENKGIIVLIK